LKPFRIWVPAVGDVRRTIPALDDDGVFPVGEDQDAVKEVGDDDVL